MGGKGGGVPASYYSDMSSIAGQEVGLSQDANNRASQEFNLTYPGLEKAEGYYTKLSSGDPAALARANAPAIQQIDQQTAGAKKKIEQDSPRGGTKNLAMEEANINQGAQVGQLTTQSYLNSFGSLAGLAGQGANTSVAESGQALSGLSSAGNTYTQSANVGAEEKASQLGFIGSLAGAGATLGAMCWIAVALFGEEAYETLVLRTYFNDVLDHHWFGKYVCKLYRAYGPGISKKIEKPGWLRLFFSILYEEIFYHAKKVLSPEAKKEVFHKYWEIHRSRMKNAG